MDRVSRHFDHIELTRNKREFVTHTGTLNGNRLSVISTGISTDNIDIVINELDALANVNPQTGEVKASPTSLSLIRLGTSGSLREDLPVDSILVSRFAIGLDGLDRYYDHDSAIEPQLGLHIKDVIKTNVKVRAYLTQASGELMDEFPSFKHGVTMTCPGFYGPQGRELRIKSTMRDTIAQLSEMQIDGTPVTNLEMETSAIYLLGALFGHKALSVNAILANRKTGEFSNTPMETVDQMIASCLEVICRD